MQIVIDYAPHIKL